MSTFKPASIGKTGILSIKKNGEQVSRYRPDLGNAEIDISSEEKLNTTGQFDTITGGILQSCNVKLDINQDLHGYSNPWVGGAGKNKLPMTVSGIKSVNTSGTWNGNVYTLNNEITVEVLLDNDSNIIGFKINGTASSNLQFYIRPMNLSIGDYLLNGGHTSEKRIFFYNGSQWYNSTTGDIAFSITGSETTQQVAIVMMLGQSFSNEIFYPMIRLSTVSDATFEPYTNICGITGHSSVEVTVSDAEDTVIEDVTVALGGTYYGGTLDVVSGKLTIDRTIVNLGSLTWTVQSTSVTGKNRFRTGDITPVDKKPSANNVVADISSSIYKAITAENTYFLNNEGVSLDTAGAILIYDSTKETLTANEFKTAMDGAQLVYALATPVVIQLTPQQINALVGENNIDIPLDGQSLTSAVYRELFAWDDVKDIVGEQVAKSDIVDNLTTNDATKVLSAKQGKVLQDTKVNISDIKDNLTSTDTNKPLSAKQGKVLDEKINGLYTELTDNEPYTLRQGKGDMVNFSLEGASVAWNQLVNLANTTNTYGDSVTVTRNTNGTVRIQSDGNNSAVDNANLLGSSSFRKFENISNHKLLFSIGGSNPISSSIVQKIYVSSSNSWTDSQVLIKNNNDFRDLIFVIPQGKEYISWYLNIQANTTCDFTLKPQIFDLTQLFGTTIADAIYAMEQATAGSGVAFFRQYFPKAYYAYDSGSIQSVNVASRKVVGKNVCPFEVDAKVSASTYWTDSIPVIGGKTITVSLDAERISGTTISNTTINLFRCKQVDSNGDEISTTLYGTLVLTASSPVTRASKIITLDANAKEIAFDLTNYNGDSNVNTRKFNFMVEYGSATETSYEPYESHIANFDTTKQLRGIPSLVNNKLVYDGDIYTPNGITRKYGIVDLGSLTWNYSSYATRFWVNTSSFGMKASAVDVIPRMLCGKELIIDTWSNVTNNLSDKSLALKNDSSEINVRHTAYTDASTFTTAMSGVYLVYELATPTTESAEPYQNPQRSDASGTEEFVDFGVSAGTRDVSIPCGHNSTYKSSEVIQPLEDYVDGYRINEIRDDVEYYEQNGFLSKNLLKISAGNYLPSGISYIVNDDGTVTVNGYNSGRTYLVLGVVSGVSGKTVRLTGCPKGGVASYSNNGYCMFVGGTGQTVKYDTGEGLTFVPDGDSFTVYINVVNTQMNSVVFKPMISFDEYATYNDYTPYAPSNLELMSMIPIKLYATGSFTSSTSTTTTVTVTNANINYNANNPIEVTSDVFGLTVSNISVSGSGTGATISITFPKMSSAQTVNYRVYIITI